MCGTKRVFGVIVALALVLVPVFAVGEEENQSLIGISMYSGEQMNEFSPNNFWHRNKNYHWRYYSFQPVYGWKIPAISDRLDLFWEANMGWIEFDSAKAGGKYETYTVSLNTSFMASFDIVRIKSGSLFAEAGVGLGYWSNTPDKNMVQPDLLGIVNYGVGAKARIADKTFLRLSWRFNHISSIPGEDGGANTEGLKVGIVKYF